MNKIGIDARLWNETGVGRYIRNLVSELQKIDTENEYVLFVRSQDRESVQETFRLRSGNKWSVKTTNIHWHTVKEQLQFGKLLEKEKLDLVHFPYFSVPIRYNGKFILTIHDLILHQFPTGKASTKSWFVYQLKHAAYKYVIAQAAKKAKKIITVSEATKQEIVSRLKVPKEKISVTYEGVDERLKNPSTSLFRVNLQSELREELKSLPKNYFLYVGNAYPHKNLERLVEAFDLFIQQNNIVIPAFTLEEKAGIQSFDFAQERIGSRISYTVNKSGMTSSKGDNSRLRSNNNIKLILVGKEDFFYKRLKQKVESLGLSENILFKHSVSDEELASLYAHAHALVMPSLMEGFGLPVLEAMRQNCLVALSDIPVFHEIAEDAALYFNPQDVQSMKNVLESIAKGTVPHETDKKNKGKEISKKFSWKKMAQQTLQIYQSCFSV